jgi:hypothetical protein
MCYLSLKKEKEKKGSSLKKECTYTDDASSTSIRAGINSQVAKV